MNIYDSTKELSEYMIKHQKLIKSLKPFTEQISLQSEIITQLKQNLEFLSFTASAKQFYTENQTLIALSEQLSAISQSQVAETALAIQGLSKNLYFPNYESHIFTNYSNLLNIGEDLKYIIDKSTPSVFFDYKMNLAFEDIKEFIPDSIFENEIEEVESIQETKYISPENIQRFIRTMNFILAIVTRYSDNLNLCITLIVLFYIIQEAIYNHTDCK